MGSQPSSDAQQPGPLPPNGPAPNRKGRVLEIPSHIMKVLGRSLTSLRQCSVAHAEFPIVEDVLSGEFFELRQEFLFIDVLSALKADRTAFIASEDFEQTGGRVPPWCSPFVGIRVPETVEVLPLGQVHWTLDGERLPTAPHVCNVTLETALAHALTLKCDSLYRSALSSRVVRCDIETLHVCFRRPAPKQPLEDIWERKDTPPSVLLSLLEAATSRDDKTTGDTSWRCGLKFCSGVVLRSSISVDVQPLDPSAGLDLSHDSLFRWDFVASKGVGVPPTRLTQFSAPLADGSRLLIEWLQRASETTAPSECSFGVISGSYEDALLTTHGPSASLLVLEEARTAAAFNHHEFALGAFVAALRHEPALRRFSNGDLRRMHACVHSLHNEGGSVVDSEGLMQSMFLLASTVALPALKDSLSASASSSSSSPPPPYGGKLAFDKWGMLAEILQVAAEVAGAVGTAPGGVVHPSDSRVPRRRSGSLSVECDEAMKWKDAALDILRRLKENDVFSVQDIHECFVLSTRMASFLSSDRPVRHSAALSASRFFAETLGDPELAVTVLKDSIFSEAVPGDSFNACPLEVSTIKQSVVNALRLYSYRVHLIALRIHQRLLSRLSLNAVDQRLSDSLVAQRTTGELLDVERRQKGDWRWGELFHMATSCEVPQDFRHVMDTESDSGEHEREDPATSQQGEESPSQTASSPLLSPMDSSFEGGAAENVLDWAKINCWRPHSALEFEWIDGTMATKDPEVYHTLILQKNGALRSPQLIDLIKFEVSQSEGARIVKDVTSVAQAPYWPRIRQLLVRHNDVLRSNSSVRALVDEVTTASQQRRHRRDGTLGERNLESV